MKSRELRKFPQNGTPPLLVKGKKKFRLLYIPIAFMVLSVIGMSCLYVYVNSHVNQNIKYVNTWDELNKQVSTPMPADTSAFDAGASAVSSQESVSSSVDSNVQVGLDALTAKDFAKTQYKGYPIIKIKQKDPQIENILIMGIDGGEPGAVGVNRSDSMIVASIDTKNNTLKLSSLMRDTKTYFPNTDSWHKLNAAYSYGGAGLQIDIINYAYKLDIQKYILIDFAQFGKIIDTIGGVPITLKANEASYSYINVGKEAGLYNLDGAHALGYVRTRKIDTDFLRTQRQRNVMTAIYNKFKDAGFQEKFTVAKQCIDYIQTNISTVELLGSLLSFESNMSSDIKQIEIPTEDDGMYTTETSPIWYWILDWDKEVAKLQNFIYGN